RGLLPPADGRWSPPRCPPPQGRRPARRSRARGPRRPPCRRCSPRGRLLGCLVCQPRSSACLADLEAGERTYRGPLLAEHLLDRLLGLLDERLLDERDLLEERAQPALDDLGDRLLRLALFPGDLLGDAPLLLADVGRPLVP